MEINYKTKREDWDEFVSSSPERSIFIKSPFLDSLEREYDLVTCKDDNRILAGTVIIKENNKPITTVFPFTEYQGILLSDIASLKIHSQISTAFKILEFFIEELVKKYGSFCLCNSWRLTDLRPFQWLNYHEPDKGMFSLTLRYSAVLTISDYKDFETYKLDMRKVRRQEVNKAEKNLEIVEIKDELILDQLHEKTFSRQGIKRDPVESALVRKITKSALKGGYGRLTCIKKNGEPIAANLFLFDDRTGFYLFGANHPEHRNTFAGTLLLADAIRDCMERKLEEVDFVGVNSPSRGDFKLSFNPTLKPYFITNFSRK